MSYTPLCGYSLRYSSEGRVTNITLPTGEVSGFHGNLERWSRVEVEASTRENFVTSTNLSAGDTIYTFRQGMALWQVVCHFFTPHGTTGTLVKCLEDKRGQIFKNGETNAMWQLCSQLLAGGKHIDIASLQSIYSHLVYHKQAIRPFMIHLRGTSTDNICRCFPRPDHKVIVTLNIYDCQTAVTWVLSWSGQTY